MPHITEDDLLNLHQQIEKEKMNNLQLLDLINKKNNGLAKKSKVIALLTGLAIILGLGLFAMISYSTGQQITFYSLFTEDKSKVDAKTYNELKVENDNLNSQNESLSEIKEYYLARHLIKDDTIYAVQVKSFSDNAPVTFSSNAFTNAHLHTAKPYLKLSLGVYETKTEALALKNTLIKAGLKDAFIASYKNGNRIRIEE